MVSLSTKVELAGRIVASVVFFKKMIDPECLASEWDNQNSPTR